MSVLETEEPIYRIPPYSYIHVLDQTSNVMRLEIGPKTYFCQDHEQIAVGPVKMITVPPRHYCIVENPVMRDTEGKVVIDSNGQAKLLHADLEVRLTQEPFPLYPGEVLKQDNTPLEIVPADTALRLRCVLDFEDETGEKRSTGDEWLFEGLGTYIPRKEVMVMETIEATVILPNQAIRLRARKECVDREGNPRVTGEEWVVKKTGAYIPGAYEEVVSVIDAYALSEKTALHMRALKTFTDDFGKVRKNAEEWLITMENTETHIPNVYEEVVGVVNITTLTKHQYCVILDPVDSKGRPQLGQKKLVKGEKTFFLMPGERLEKGIQDVYILAEDESLVLRSLETFKDHDMEHDPGDRWMIRGPKEYVPPVQVEVVARRKAFPLDDNEGIYVRNLKTGRVCAISGKTYMLSEDEELWEKEVSLDVEKMLTASATNSSSRTRARDKTRVITYYVPFNDAVQIYDYKEKRSRVVFGPEMVMLGPYEQFVQTHLSFARSCYYRFRDSTSDFFQCNLCRKRPKY